MSPETRQQIIALVLGLVFIVGFVLFAQRLGQFLRNRQQQAKVASGAVTPTPSTPSKVLISPTPTLTVSGQNRQPVRTTGQPATIPQTGPELMLLGGLGSLLASGFMLRRASRSK